MSPLLPAIPPTLRRRAQPVATFRADRPWHRQHLLLLLVWEFLPYLVPTKAGTNCSSRSPVNCRHAVGYVRQRLDLGAARGQRLRLCDRPFVGDRRRSAARHPARSLQHPGCDVRPVHHRLQRDAATGLPAAADGFGIGLWSKVAVVFLGGLSRCRRTPTRGAQRRHAADQCRTLVRRHGSDIARLVVVPSSLPIIVVGLRLVIGRAVLGVVVSEFFGSQEGLGVVMVRAASAFEVNVVFAGLIIFAGLSLAHDRAGQAARRPHDAAGARST